MMMMKLKYIRMRVAVQQKQYRRDEVVSGPIHDASRSWKDKYTADSVVLLPAHAVVVLTCRVAMRDDHRWHKLNITFSYLPLTRRREQKQL